MQRLAQQWAWDPDSRRKQGLYKQNLDWEMVKSPSLELAHLQNQNPFHSV